MRHPAVVLLIAAVASVALANDTVDAWFARLTEDPDFASAPCPDWAEDARGCAVVLRSLRHAISALGFVSPPGFRGVGEGSDRRVQVPDQCQGWDTAVWRSGCRLMHEYIGPGTVVLVLDREYLLLYIDNVRIEAELAAAKDVRDARRASEEAARQSRLDAERRENLSGLDTIGKVREMTRDLFTSLNYGSRSCEGIGATAHFALCGQTHGDVEVFTQFTETHLLRSAYFDGEIRGPWQLEGAVARMPLLIDGRRVTITFEGEQRPFQNFGTILIELHD